MLDHNMNVINILDKEDPEDLVPTLSNKWYLNATSKQPLDIKALLTNPKLLISPDPLSWDVFLISTASYNNP